MRRSVKVVLLVGGLLTTAIAPARAQSADSICARDVLVARSMQRQAADQLEAAGDDEGSRCRVWRRHVDTMRRLAGVYGRCLSGPERKQSLDDVRASETDFAGLIKTRCAGR